MKQQAIVVTVLAVLGGIGVWVFVSTAPMWVQALCGVLATLGSGLAGTPPDQCVLDVPTVSPYAPAPLRVDMVTEAYGRSASPR